MECKTQRLIEEERATTMVIESRKEKRKAMKKMKRKQTRKETALKEREEQEARLNDPQFLMEMTVIEQEEAQRSERARKEFDEREAAWLIQKQEQEQEEAEQQRRIKSLEDEQQQQIEKATEDDDGEYVEDGPAEVIWQGNEIIVKKKRVKVLKKNTDEQRRKEDDDRPTSNPLPPQSEVFADYNNASLSAQQLIETVAQQVPHFGTEQDKAHCPFHLKTGACRFGQRCSRVHFYPDKSSTLLIKNMYNGPGLAWEQDEGLEYTDEEVDLCFEEFYEDVHTEFLKFGEIINFKVCRNGAFHLRGNVYIQYSALDAAVLAQQSINGRYFAGKQISCEYINVTRWKVAICGEYMKSRYKTCSRGTACNFIHCFRNPGGDYEWADSDRPPPKYWVEKMVALFGYSDAYEKQMMEDNSRQLRNNSKMSMTGSARSGSRRSSSRERSYTSFTGSGRRYDDENYSGHGGRTGENKHADQCQENSNSKDSHYRKSRKYYTESDGVLEKGGDLKRDHGRTRKISRSGNRDHKQKTYETESDETEYDGYLSDRAQNKLTKHGSTRKSSRRHGKAYMEKIHEVDKDSSTRDKERDLYSDCRRSSRQKRKVGCADNHKVSKNRAHDSEGEWSDSHRKGDEHQSLRKSLWNIGDDFLDEDAGNDACHARKRSKHWDKVDKSHGDRAPDHGDHLILKEADFLTKDLRSRGTHEPSNLDQHDLRCLSNVQIDNQDLWNSETGSAEMYHNSSNRKAGSSESYESGRRPGERGETDEFDLKLYYGDKSEKVTCSKHQKSRRKSMESHHNLDNRKRSQGSSAEQTEYSEDNKKTGSKRKKKHRSRDHKHGSPQE